MTSSSQVNIYMKFTTSLTTKDLIGQAAAIINGVANHMLCLDIHLLISQVCKFNKFRNLLHTKNKYIK
jgi:hypothetical protein